VVGLETNFCEKYDLIGLRPIFFNSDLKLLIGIDLKKMASEILMHPKSTLE